ncbi:DUF4350 domain-containing protein [Actinotalea sp. M2MS4P-6]|uniref:DUF4350 domain-containing protein n=1 Tax=Actinotalea sp. M2MS4P-6 TaxID=2983762 RepID=UPI0021E4F8EB|nr:DUF4350 domain-containing protein [Actinotalea sp. M2MS4P-6]MCV2394149.1 DUF4350 domain-containing protein [Actinotalea sp. M2MS4P-6]
MSQTTSEPVRLGGEPPRSVAGRRWRRWRLPVLIGALLLTAALLAALIQPQVSREPLAVDNPGSTGVRALAQVLGDQGVVVHEVQTTADAVALAQPGTTLAIVGSLLLTDADLDQLARTGADLVVIDGDSYALDVLTDGQVAETWAPSAQLRSANCDDPDATAAELVSDLVYSVTLTGGSGQLCFTATNDPQTGGYAVVEAGGRTVRVLADSTILTNGSVTEQGNAALGLRMLGHHDHLIWFRPSLLGTGTSEGSATGFANLPPWAGPFAALLGLVVLVAAVWRGRALGRVVSEPLPVTVRAAETTRGRGRLYRRARSRGHAAAALRAAVARRTAVRLGLPASADAPTMIEAVASATGRPTHDVAGLLYGPPPSDDAELLVLTRALDQLESEVHRT